ncbi:MAG: hypothetical protein RL248_2059 [Pseudomonadota bacterium]
MTTQVPPTSLLPLAPEQLARLQAAVSEFSPTQMAWLSGYFWGMVNQQPCGVAAPVVPPTATITLISASQTGNARRLAEQLRDDLLAVRLNVNLVNAGDYKFKQIAQERLLIMVASTQGTGEPAEEAVSLHKFLFSKKAPKLPETAFAVFGLGDTSYEHFCQASKDFDTKLVELGAQRLLERVDADVEYQQQAQQWRQQVVAALQARVSLPSVASATLTQRGVADDITSSPYSKTAPLTARLSVQQKITGRNSEKDVRHIEIDLGGSGLRYQPGDALGVWFDNDPALVDELLALLWLKGDELVSVDGKNLPLAQALRRHFELTQNTAVIVDKYATLSRDEKLIALLADKPALQQYARNTPIVDMVRQASSDLNAEQLMALLRPLTPRFYSIASSQAETENEVHITVGVVRYDIDGRPRTGGASGYLADRLEVEDDIRVFIEHNDNFRLPANPETPVIMIGPGTGIAPFRAFMQQREAEGANGKNWLFFGNPHFIDDFLYQVEWQRYVKEGLLTRIDLAWSRDQVGKIYVQDKLREQGAELWHWLQQGAHIYVCGDANRMAKDVEQVLLDVISKHGAMDTGQADEYLSELRQARRYQRDVY